MSVTDSKVVDAVGVDRETGDVTLTLSDHLPWGDRAHLELLQTKLNSYLAFVESGELLEAYPKAVDRGVTIEVVCKFQPDAAGRRFLAEAASLVGSAGFGFVWNQLKDEAV